MPHLWEIDHPYIGAEGYAERVDSFAELRAAVDEIDEDLNFVYRWDWHTDGDSGEEFAVYVLMPRKEGFWSITCPISRDQEAEVLEWLRGPRVLGALRKWWEPLLDDITRPAGPDVH